MADDVLLKLQENFPGGLAQTQAAFSAQVAAASVDLKESLAKLPVVLERNNVIVRQSPLDTADPAIQVLIISL